jgi:hypothetical protein
MNTKQVIAYLRKRAGFARLDVEVDDLGEPRNDLPTLLIDHTVKRRVEISSRVRDRVIADPDINSNSGSIGLVCYAYLPKGEHYLDYR